MLRQNTGLFVIAAARASMEMSTNSSPPAPRVLRPPQSRYDASAKSTLPDGWVAIVDLIKQYNAPETSAMRNMRPYLKEGSWKANDGRTVKYALDPDGIAEFQRRYVR